MKDQEIANDISRYLQDRGATTISHKQKAGVLVLACYRGVFVAVQIRKPGKRMTNKQVEFSRACGRAGGIHIVAHGTAEVKHTLKIMDTWMAHAHDNGARATQGR
jgi:hypothetical protein